MYVALWTYQNVLRCKYFDSKEAAFYKAVALVEIRKIDVNVLKVIAYTSINSKGEITLKEGSN